jgi:CheY-like chemotaxis protein
MKDLVKILAIDDEQVILHSIKKLCSAEGWNADTAIDASLALKMLNDTPYNLVVCDIMMPQMDGFEFLEELRKKEIKTPVIITTGFSTVENAVKSLYSGAIDFLPKPFTYDELISSVKRGLRYGEIQEMVVSKTFHSDSSSTSISHIPCPPKYKRLGYSTWSFLEEDGSVRIGLTDLFLQTIDPVTGIDLLHYNDEIVQGNTCCFIETEDQLTHNVLAPISGRIIQRNEQLLDNHSLIEKDPYFKGWLYVIIPGNLEYESKHLVPCSSDRL